MSELEVIQGTVARTARRRRWQNAWRGLWRGLLLGALFYLASLVVYKLLPLPDATLLVAGLIALFMAPGVFLLGWLRPVSLAETARWIDVQGHFQERLSTALEVAQDKRAKHWSELLLADAAEHARRFNPGTSLPYRLPKSTRWTLLILVLGVGLGFVPEYRSQRYQEKRLETAVMQDAGRRLDLLVRHETEQRPPVLESTRQSFEAVQDLAAQLSQAKLTRTDALRELASVTERLRKEARELGRAPALPRLNLGARNMDPMKSKLDRLQQSAAGLPETGSPGADAARSELSQELADLARQAKDSGFSIPNLDEAIAALEASQIDQMLREIQAASSDLEQMSKMAQASQDLQLQPAEIGRNLAEQLDQGQGIPALASLEELMRQLSDPNLSREELDRLLKEIRDAAKPGNQYGQMGEMLTDAARQLQQGDRKQAGFSLSSAAEELRQLMEQMGDFEGLLSALEGLQIAQMSVGNSMGWGECRSELAGFKPGGKPGRGMGIGTDDDHAWMGAAEKTGSWDNRGVDRPDFDPRSLSDRDLELSDALTPTQVQGQISPGRSLPSITLRGLSVRGESRIAYEEAVAIAQTDAQSALSQQRVPRAYERVVRDYFDEL
jgi:hypothetical protein